MRGRAENTVTRTLAVFTTLLLLTVTTGLSLGYQASNTVKEPSVLTNAPKLEDEKLRQEIRKLQIENEKLISKWEIIRSLAPFLTALGVAIGALWTIWKQINESNIQRDLDRRQREADSVRRSSERFTSIVSGLGSDSKVLQASAAVSMMTFVKPQYKDFHEQVFLILLANLKIGHGNVINKLLVAAFDVAIRRYLEYEQEQGGKVELDLSRCWLDHVDLSGLDLSHADIGFAYFRSANLTGTNLFRVRGIKAHLDKARLSTANLNEARLRSVEFRDAQFHNAIIVAADLKEADLRNAQFQQAKMQSAHLDNAKLSGAEFEQANISDAFFKGAIFDEHALKSIIKAKNWQNAHFDDEIKVRLETLANSHS
jgi:uncharacterized protein YjbI with pentapeptide repeats